MDNILTKLYEKISEITDFKMVYKGVVKTIDQYPSCIIYPIGFKDEYLSLRKIKRIYSFNIVIHQIIRDDLGQTQSQVYSLIDSVLNKLNSNINLDGIIDFSLLQNGENSFITREGDIYICQINYTAIKSLDF